MSINFKAERRFKITTDEIDRTTAIYSFQRNNYTNYFPDFESRLEDLIDPEYGIIDGDRLKQFIFPTNNQDIPLYNVFISHSHNDKTKAENLAKWLKNRGYEPFLDNYIWGSADYLLRKLDDKYCLHENGHSYDYDKRNFSTSHVHAMLSMAIFEMISRCESFIFIESAESINFNILRDYGSKTLSPWIYLELQYVNTLASILPATIEERRKFSDGGNLRMSHGADLSQFKALTSANINNCFPNLNTSGIQRRFI